jgi:hypothetical protein
MVGSLVRSCVVMASLGLVAFAACGNSDSNEPMPSSGAAGTPSGAGGSMGGSSTPVAGAGGGRQAGAGGHAGGGDAKGEGGSYAGAAGADDAAGAGGEAGASNSDEYQGCQYSGSETGVYLRILDTLNSSPENTNTVAVSADGSAILGGSADENGQTRGVIWRPDGSLQDLFAASNGLLMRAAAASCDGKIALVHGLGARYLYTEAGGSVPIPGCGGELPAMDAVGMDESGRMLVGYCQSASTLDTYPRRWAGSQGPLPLDDFKGYGLAISGDGLVFAGLREDGSSRRAFRWTEASGTQMLFETVSGTIQMSADGSTIVAQGGELDAPFVRWRNGVETPLPCDVKQTYCFPTLVSGNGRTILLSVDGEIMVWHDDEPLLSLRDVLEAAGVDLSPWQAFVVTAWTPDKRVLVGSLQETSVADQVPFYLVLPKGTL